MALAVAVFATALVPVSVGNATQAQNDQVCEGLDSGKKDVSGNQKTVVVTAPDGQLIDRYCVKAGSANQDEGPKYVDVNPPQKTVTISHPSGKDISHYSVSYTTVTGGGMGGGSVQGSTSGSAAAGSTRAPVGGVNAGSGTSALNVAAVVGLVGSVLATALGLVIRTKNT